MTLNQTTLRTNATQERYMHYLASQYKGNCIFCDKELLEKEYDYWIIIKNRFPYDKCFINHRLLAPKRHFERGIEMNVAEEEELERILEEEDFNQCILNKKENRSIPLHFHYHLVTIK